MTHGELDRYKACLLRDSQHLAEQWESVPSVDNLDYCMECLALDHTFMAQEEVRKTSAARWPVRNSCFMAVALDVVRAVTDEQLQSDNLTQRREAAAAYLELLIPVASTLLTRIITFNEHSEQWVMLHRCHFSCDLDCLDL